MADDARSLTKTQASSQAERDGLHGGGGDTKAEISNDAYRDDEHTPSERHSSDADEKQAHAATTKEVTALHGVDAEAERKLRQAGLVPLADEAPFTREEFKATLRRIDMVLMPFMCLSVFLQYLDKTSLNYANLLHIKEDLHFGSRQYSWLGSIFYIGYLAASPLHGWCLQKFSVSRYLGVCIFLWGGTLALHAAAFNYAGLVACRLFLGIFEGALTPGFILLTGRFYQSKEQVARTSIWFSMNGWAQIIGGAISYGVQVQRSTTLKVWQELYVILGVITLAFSGAVFLFMPESPEVSKIFRTDRMRMVAVERIRSNKTGLHDRRWKWYQFREALLDVRIYLIFLLIITTDIANGITSNFSSAILSGLGFDSKRTALVGMSTGVSEVVALMLAIAIANVTNTRWIPSVFSFAVAIAGGAIVLGVKDQVSQVAGYNLIFFFPVASALLYSWLSSAVGGSTKRTTLNVTLQLGYCAGNIIGPQAAGEAPAYRLGKSVMLAMFVVSALATCAISGVHYLWNTQRDRAREQGQDEPALSELADYTDKELRSFRYPY